MNRLPLLLLLVLLLTAVGARAQFGSFGDVPIEINAEETRFENGVAVAERNVIIRYGAVSVYCDYAQYNPDTRDLLALGDVRIFQGAQMFAGERAVYNLETKQLTAADVRGSSYPAFVQADIINSIGPNAYQGRNVVATTDDNSNPMYHIRARNMRLYRNNYVVFNDVKLYVGQTPILWLPYIYQNLNKEQGFTFTPGYSSNLGAYLLTKYTYPLGDIGVTLKVDLMSTRGVGVGLDATWGGASESGNSSSTITKGQDNWGRLRSYYIDDLKPEENPTSNAREPIDPQRYRVTFQDRTYLTEDIYSSVDINKLSDARFLQDFEPGEFKRNPNPDNMIALTKWDEDYTVTLLAREQLNTFFDFTERLPDLTLDMKRKPVFGDSGLFYQGESSASYLRRNFADNSFFADYDSLRLDTFHQFTLPKTLFGWLNVVPKAGVRGTYYGNSGHFQNQVTRVDAFNTAGEVIGFQEIAKPQLVEGGSTFRTTLNAGMEASFKVSKAYEQVQSRPWGLDGLRHVMQPYADFSYVYTDKRADEILQFDRINPSTKLPAIDFPQFNSIDSIDPWTILRLGVANRFETRRDNNTITWFEANTFVDVRFQRPEFEKIFLGFPVQPKLNQHFTEDQTLLNRVGDPGTFSNLYNDFRFNPVPWAGFRVETQNPIFDKGFNEVNTTANWMVTDSVQLIASHRYLSGNSLFQNSNQLTLGGYVRMGENWGLSVRETYEFETGLLQVQRYELHRDLSAVVGTFGVIVNNNGDGKVNYGVELIFTLKDLPMARLPLNFDPADLASGTGTGKNK